MIEHYRRHSQVELPLEEYFPQTSEENPSNVVDQETDAQRIRSALLKLSAEQRQVIELRFMENWSHDDVAIALGKTIETTRALQDRAMEALRRALAEGD
jgi:RNA polymerase sigma-70 factor (ECF subfamily)